MNLRKTILLIAMILCTYSIGIDAAIQEGQEFISFGANLTVSQRDQIYDLFRPVQQARVLEVTNSEEYYYLSKYIPREQIGSRAISSVYLQTLAAGAGVQVQTEKITWVTSGMYANAAVTAGIKDVLIKAAAPFPVSGTAALTGIFKAFETAQGQPIDRTRKDVAYQELVTQGELGEDMGQENAEQLIRDVKEEVIERRVSDPQAIRIIIEEQAREYNIKLTDEQIRQIEHLMERIHQLNLNVSEINNQLKSLETRVKGIQKQGEQAKGLLAQIAAFLQKIFAFIVNLFS